ncbi:hypothetical protein IFM89_029774 [Coptis chinensis]|uniref:ribonuclease P n=1 Tax=Coptis chinensis TaxID=261450 RepID=A0A835M4U9_9MAGN|nr:hypothetical protein IFM89_029774 [Coptis chinensis]
MATMSTFNTLQLQQKQLFSITLCKYHHPSLLSFTSHYSISHLFTIPTLKHNMPSLSTLKATLNTNNNNNAKTSSVEHKQSQTNTLREKKYGFSRLRSRDERVGNKAKFSSVVGEKVGKKYKRDAYVRKDVESRRSREMRSGNSSLSSNDERVEINYKKNEVRAVVDEKVTRVYKNSKVGNEKMDKKSNCSVGEGKMGKRSRKKKVETPELLLRVGLDMCSKKGDFLGAISYYDSAQKQGVELGQYHYTVLLYLCSSAAVGVLRPAKSGSGSRRSLDNMDLTTEVSDVKSEELSKMQDIKTQNFDLRIDSTVSSNELLVDSSESHGSNATKMREPNSNETEDSVNVCDYGFLNQKGIRIPSKDKTDGLEENLYDKITNSYPPNPDGFTTTRNRETDSTGGKDGISTQEDCKILVSEDVKKYALTRGFEIYEKMCLENIPLNEASLTSVARLAMSMGNGKMALEMVNRMKEMGINPRLRSYGPALFTFCSSGDVENAFMVEEHMLGNGVYAEEPELEALLRLSVQAGRGDKVYYLLHTLRKSIRKVSPCTADLIESWFRSTPASRVGEKEWDERLIKEAMEKRGGGWHGQSWLGRGKWTVVRTSLGTDGVCESCGDKLVTIDLDPIETENFAKSVASIASKRERSSSFQNFEKWLDYYGPFEAVVDAANVGLFSQRKFSTSKVNAIVNGIRQKLPSKKWPLIILHNKRVTGSKMDEPANKFLLEKWKNADALYATPTGSNDDWYWLYAAIKFKCFLVTNDEMRDHIFQLLGNDFFPRWKERHQVRFSFSDGGPEFNMPPPCSVVIQESEKGHWHIPVELEDGSERERTWLCVTRTDAEGHKSTTRQKDHHSKEGCVNADAQSRSSMKLPKHGIGGNIQKTNQHSMKIYRNLNSILSDSVIHNSQTLVFDIEEAEKLGGCIIDFQI